MCTYEFNFFGYNGEAGPISGGVLAVFGPQDAHSGGQECVHERCVLLADAHHLPLVDCGVICGKKRKLTKD